MVRKIALINHVASAKTMVESLANLFPICLKLLNGIPYGEQLGTDCVAIIVLRGLRRFYAFMESVG